MTAKNKKALNKAMKAKKEGKPVNAEETKKKQSTVKEEVKKITAAKEPKKITTAKEPKKIAASKEPEKIAAQPEPKKLSTQPEPKEEKKVVKKTAAKEKTTKSSEKAKRTAKRVKEETATPKKAVKKASKASVKKTVEEPKLDLKNVSLDDCMWRLNEKGADVSYEMVAAMLLDEKDMKKVVKGIAEDKQLSDATALTLLQAVVEKISQTMDIKAADFAQIKKAMAAFEKGKLGDDDEANAQLYLDAFKTAEKILMIAQRKQIALAADVSKLLGSDVAVFMEHFFQTAYDLLPSWQYSDVKFYEDFAYAILSQFEDLYELHQLRIQLDVADLYIKHGDFGQGDACYGYILRDNQIKDYIYYRYASVYESIDINRAKEIAYGSMQYVDERYTYYPQLAEIINK
ncbi:neurofilament protein [Amedibacillus dolichus]|uniref:neurofilament protein n=1 Tax=Amedibacillus dolichus TaxID=31971 RepID=UPI00241D33FB|nr:neurofilament protein [Amedibacillus dolichus]